MAPIAALTLPWDEQEKIQVRGRIPPKRRVAQAFAAGLIVSVCLGWWTRNHLLANTTELPDDLPQSEALEMKAAIGQDSSVGTFIGLARIPTKDGARLLVGRNEAGKSARQVVVEGVPDTLVGAFYFRQTFDLQFVGGLASVQIPGPLSKGFYKVKVVCPSCVGGDLEKVYFFGGTQDEAYDSQLRISHDALREKARHELQEMDQITQTLNVQANSDEALFSNVQFPKVHATDSAVDNSQWWKMQSQLRGLLEAEQGSSQNPIFYTEGYKELRDLERQTSIAHASLEKAVASTPIAPAFIESLGLAQNQLRARIAKFSTQLKTWENMPLSSNGMPKK